MSKFFQLKSYSIMNKTKHSNRINEELLCVRCLEDYLRNQDSCGEIHIQREQEDPPDFWMTIADKKFALEVTSIVKNEAYFSRCKRLSKDIEGWTKQNGYLSGKYILLISRNPEIPKVNSRYWKKLIQKSVTYICQTTDLLQAEKTMLYQDSKGKVEIEKVGGKGASWVGNCIVPELKWKGQIQEELRELFQEAVKKKRISLEKKGVNKHCPEIILLLYDAYIYADIEDARESFKGIEGADWFHSVFCVQAIKVNANKLLNKDVQLRGWFLFTKDKIWSEEH